MLPEDRAYENTFAAGRMHWTPEIYGLAARQAVQYALDAKSDGEFCTSQMHAINWARKAWRLALQREAREDAMKRNEANRLDRYARGVM